MTLLAKQFEGELWVKASDLQAESTLVAQQAAMIEQMREALSRVFHHGMWPTCDMAAKALALQPCPEVLNKVRAEAVRELYHWYMDQDVFNHLGEAAIETFIAQRIEQGEA